MRKPPVGTKRITLLTVILFALIVAVFAILIRFRPEREIAVFDRGWTMTCAGEVREDAEISELIDILAGETVEAPCVVLTRTLDDVEEGLYAPTLLLDMYYLAAEVYLEGELVASPQMERFETGRFMEAQYYFITLPDGYEGKELSIRLYADQSGADDFFDTPSFGSFRDLMRTHLVRNAYPLFIGIFMILFGIYFLIVSIFFTALIPEIKGQLISAVLSLCVGLWTLTQFRLTSLVMRSEMTTLVEYATYFSFVPIYYLIIAQVRNHTAKQKKIFQVAALVQAVILGAFVLLHAANILHVTNARVIFYFFCLVMTLMWVSFDIHDIRTGNTGLLNVLQMAGPTVFAFFAWIGALWYLFTSFMKGIPPSFASRIIFSTGGVLFVVIRYMIYFFLLVETQSRKLEFESLTRIANMDTLTGLYNRHYSTDRFAELNESRRDYCLVSLDLNHLKYVNDTFGHGKGDALLIAFSSILMKAFPEEARCCRMGGDEFLVIVESITEEHVQTCIARCAAEFAQLDKTEPMIPHSVASGYAFRHELPDKDAHAVFLLADQRMYALKQTQKEKEGLTYASADEGEDLMPFEPASTVMQEMVSDVNARMDTARKRRLDAIFTAIASSSEDVSAFLCDMHFDYSRWGKSVVEYFGMPGEYMHGAASLWEQHIHPEDREAFHQSMEAVWNGSREGHDMQYRALSKEGKYVVVTSRGVVVKDEDGRPEYFMGSIKNHGIQSHIDPVTGLRNQFGFTEDINDLLRGHIPATVLLLGINQFAQINDIFGYSYGSRVLSKVGRLIMDTAGNSGEVYRMEGARFAIVSRDYTEEELAKCYRLLQTSVKTDFFVDGKRQNLILHGGLLQIDNFRVSVTTVSSCLNYAVNESANRKNGDLVVFKNEMMDENRRTMEMLNVIRGCIVDNFRGFYLCYQYLVDAYTEEITGAEALLRWHNDFYGNVPPGQYVPVLEQDPLFPELGSWVLRQAMTDGRRFLELYPGFVMNVNLSYSQMEKFDFVSMVGEIIEETGFPADHLCLEVTESCRVLDTQMLKNIIDSLKTMGVRFALDDFGTGFSSLSVLRRINFDVVKIDREFIIDIENSMQPENTIRAIVMLAQNYGSAVCVEGVETHEAVLRLRALPIMTFQGFYFAKPRPMEELMEEIQARAEAGKAE
ncbi:MAG: EAL domain-containing protein [Lachnospiraceae bacterium]|nr:EAL domain-containing protein [Lachnospiraceae bacterium]